MRPSSSHSLGAAQMRALPLPAPSHWRWADDAENRNRNNAMPQERARTLERRRRASWASKKWRDMLVTAMHRAFWSLVRVAPPLPSRSSFLAAFKRAICKLQSAKASSSRRGISVRPPALHEAVRFPALCSMPLTISDLRSPAPSALMDQARFVAGSKHRPGPCEKRQRGYECGWAASVNSLQNLRQGTTPPRIACSLQSLLLILSKMHNLRVRRLRASHAAGPATCTRTGSSQETAQRQSKTER